MSSSSLELTGRRERKNKNPYRLACKLTGEFHVEDKRKRRKLVLVSLLTGAKFCNWANEDLQLLVRFPNVGLLFICCQVEWLFTVA